jgi:hypothetical protein
MFSVKAFSNTNSIRTQISDSPKQGEGDLNDPWKQAPFSSPQINSITRTVTRLVSQHTFAMVWHLLALKAFYGLFSFCFTTFYSLK